MAKHPSVYWRFLRQPGNRAILGWLGGGVATVAAGIWLVLTYYLPAAPPLPKALAHTSECHQTIDQGLAACEGGLHIAGPVTIAR
jgi:hypothetical protein